jgi:hypothetical protein
MRGVVLGQMRIGFGIAQIIHGNDLDFAGALGLVQRAQHIAADAAIAINGNFDRHEKLLWDAMKGETGRK